MGLRPVRGPDHRRDPARPARLGPLDRGLPGRETPEQVAARIDRCLDLAESLSHGGDVAVFGHAHSLRVLGARWIGLPVAGGGRLRLDPGGVSVLGHEHGQRVVLRWNQPLPGEV